MSFNLIKIRRQLHQYPELSHQEENTAAFIVEKLTSLGLKPQTNVAGHGVVALLKGSKPGPTLLYRADMDALPIQEENTHDYKSMKNGVMHACGHDVHITIALGIAQELAKQTEKLCGSIKFVFQPAEEAAPPPGSIIGAEKMVAEGVLFAPKVDAAFALHVMPSLNVGELGFTNGSVWAASDLFDITITGKMTHGAYPHKGADPIYAGAQIVQALQQIPARNVDGREAAVISVCSFQAGSAYNIIPKSAELLGLLRTLKPNIRKLALRRIREISQGIANSANCSANVQLRSGAKLTQNNVKLELVLRSILEKNAHLENMPKCVTTSPQLGAEDFAAFAQRVPSVYLLLGVCNKKIGIDAMLHTPKFDIDERAIAFGVNAMSLALLTLGETWDPKKDT